MLARAIPWLLIGNLLACPLVCAAANCCSLRSDADNTRIGTTNCCTAKYSAQPAPHADRTAPNPAHPLPGSHECRCLCQADFWVISGTKSLLERCEPSLQRSVEHFTYRSRLWPATVTADLHHRKPPPITGRRVRCLCSSLLC